MAQTPVLDILSGNIIIEYDIPGKCSICDKLIIEPTFTFTNKETQINTNFIQNAEYLTHQSCSNTKKYNKSPSQQIHSYFANI